MKTFKEYLLNSKDFDLFIKMYTDSPNNPAAAMLWEAMRSGHIVDVLRNCDCQDEKEMKGKKDEGSG